MGAAAYCSRHDRLSDVRRREPRRREVLQRLRVAARAGAPQGAQVRDGAVRGSRGSTAPRRARRSRGGPVRRRPNVRPAVQEIARYEGLLEKFMGDAVLAVFGVPRAHEDDAERAVRAALEMQAVLSELNRGFAAEGKPTLEMRIGVEAGRGARRPRARERAARPDADRRRGEHRGAPAGRGRARPHRRRPGGLREHQGRDRVPRARTARAQGQGRGGPGVGGAPDQGAHPRRAAAPRAGVPARRPRRGAGGADPDACSRVETEGRPALVTIVGPAGVGKSRLVAELEHLRRGPAEFVYWRRGRCLAYGEHLVLCVRRRDQGAVRDLRGRRGRGRGEEGRCRGRASCSATTRWRRSSGRSSVPATPGREPRGPVRGLAAVPRAYGRALPARPGA